MYNSGQKLELKYNQEEQPNLEELQRFKHCKWEKTQP